MLDVLGAIFVAVMVIGMIAFGLWAFTSCVSRYQ